MDCAFEKMGEESCKANSPCANICKLFFYTTGRIHCRDFEIAKEERGQVEGKLGASWGQAINDSKTDGTIQ